MNPYETIANEIIIGSDFVTENGIELVLAEQDHVRLRGELTQKRKNRYGIAHGGFLYTAADSAAGLAAFTDGRSYVTEDSHIQFIRPLRSGVFYADSRVLHRGRSVVTVLVNLIDESETLLAHGTFNMFCISPHP